MRIHRQDIGVLASRRCVDLRRQIGRVRRVADIGGDGEPGRLQRVAHRARGARAVSGVCAKTRAIVIGLPASLFSSSLVKLHVGPGEIAAERGGAEDKFAAAAGDVRRLGVGHEERNAPPLGERLAAASVSSDWPAPISAATRPGAIEAQGLALRDRGIAEVVGKDHLDLRTLQPEIGLACPAPSGNDRLPWCGLSTMSVGRLDRQRCASAPIFAAAPVNG